MGKEKSGGSMEIRHFFYSQAYERQVCSPIAIILFLLQYI